MGRSAYVLTIAMARAFIYNTAVIPNLFNVMDPFEDFPESCGPLK